MIAAILPVTTLTVSADAYFIKISPIKFWRRWEHQHYLQAYRANRDRMQFFVWTDLTESMAWLMHFVPLNRCFRDKRVV